MNYTIGRYNNSNDGQTFLIMEYVYDENHLLNVSCIRHIVDCKTSKVQLIVGSSKNYQDLLEMFIDRITLKLQIFANNRINAGLINKHQCRTDHTAGQ